MKRFGCENALKLKLKSTYKQGKIFAIHWKHNKYLSENANDFYGLHCAAEVHVSGVNYLQCIEIIMQCLSENTDHFYDLQCAALSIFV